jgi:hypothetical protein
LADKALKGLDFGGITVVEKNETPLPDRTGAWRSDSKFFIGRAQFRDFHR